MSSGRSSTRRGALPLLPQPVSAMVRSARADLSDDGWAEQTSTIELDPQQLQPDAVAGVDEFSHIEVVFHSPGSRACGAWRPPSPRSQGSRA
jgi:tRNA (Thr-GGU) A37 N-methylase